jgi:hypothetical protein
MVDDLHILVLRPRWRGGERPKADARKRLSRRPATRGCTKSSTTASASSSARRRPRAAL